MRFPVVIHHEPEAELVATFPCYGHANEPATETRHEVDMIRGHQGCGHDQIALVFPTFVVDENDHAALAKFLYEFFSGVEIHGSMRPLRGRFD
jgi:hypothetical protein